MTSQAGHTKVMKRKTTRKRTAPTVVTEASAEKAATAISVVMATWPLLEKNLWGEKTEEKNHAISVKLFSRDSLVLYGPYSLY